ncbi:hypothetical protein Ocin01_12596 [Orchesella cincta]|uniref:Uncharacterized protein n=1 Tax=Orchesella cincta TaxID=48709 RepID=A0A1D2MMI3_ORCCI|nr:hypothetical protein Ocin01_12596 [Orchesella cincta]
MDNIDFEVTDTFAKKMSKGIPSLSKLKLKRSQGKKKPPVPPAKLARPVPTRLTHSARLPPEVPFGMQRFKPTTTIQ